MARKRTKGERRAAVWHRVMGQSVRPVVRVMGGRVWVELAGPTPEQAAQGAARRAAYQRAAQEVDALERMWAGSPDA